jgi:[ribosomal protein S18]-alanine N-acetyltransferase
MMKDAAGPSSAPNEATRLLPMTAPHLDAVLAIENVAYEFPWSRGNFVDSLSAGHEAQMLCTLRGELLGYLVALPGFEEMHLLNLTVAPAAQGRGHARCMLAWLVARCGEQGAQQLWLEVRDSNARARRIYQRFGFAGIGTRKGYYPAPLGRREDAVVMGLQITPTAANPTEPTGALD